MRKITQEEYVERVKAIYGESAYDYSNIVYDGGASYVTIVCATHGTMSKRAANFLAGHGCTKCGLKQSAEVRAKKAADAFVENARKVHGDKYDYSAVQYIRAHRKVKIICPVHDVFEVNPAQHLYGIGCAKCGYVANGLACRSTKEEFVDRAITAHGDKYDYSLVHYEHAHKKVDIGCKRCNSVFSMKPNTHLNGNGCNKCGKKGYRKELPGTLYVLAHDNVTKIGITNRKTTRRIVDINKSYGHKFTVLYSQQWEDGSIAQATEKTILTEFREKYNQPTEEFDGSTECFLDVDWQELLTRIYELTKENT